MILSIESSCDDSSIAITEIKTKKLVFHKKISQTLEHSKFGGVVPELASRLHTKALPQIVEECKPFFPKLKAIAVTTEPGLLVTLIEGTAVAKALAIGLNLPLISVNHLRGHIYSLFIEKETQFPALILLVSGGHTQILEVFDWNKFNILASTLDDSLGESFDKVSKMLGLGYPGGPIIEELAKSGDENKFNWTVPLSQSPKIAFSYSGLKNSVRLEIEKAKHNKIDDNFKNDISASFQKIATLHLIQKLKKVLKTRKGKFKYLGIVGGVSANRYIFQKIDEVAKQFSLKTISPKLEFCSDNGAMIGRYAIELYQNSVFTPLENLN